MARIVIIGAGVMGSALAVPASAVTNSDTSFRNQVSLIGSPLDNEIIASVNASRYHPDLKLKLSDNITAIAINDMHDKLLREADIVIIGVSSPGVDWAVQLLNNSRARPNCLALVTKGLIENTNPNAPPLTYAEALDSSLTQPQGQIVGIGGPCIARELALKLPTRVTFASHDLKVASELRDAIQTDYYRITINNNITALEACAALKNFLCIGVSAISSAYPVDDGYAKNPVAALFNQAVQELAILSTWIHTHARAEHHNGNIQTVSDDRSHNNTNAGLAFDLAGMGDLHVTVGGGRNSRLGNYLGRGQLLMDVLNGDMHGVTVEGVDTGRRLLPGFRAACERKELDAALLPLTAAILDTIDNNTPFNFDFKSLPG